MKRRNLAMTALIVYLFFLSFTFVFPVLWNTFGLYKHLVVKIDSVEQHSVCIIKFSSLVYSIKLKLQNYRIMGIRKSLFFVITCFDFSCITLYSWIVANMWIRCKIWMPYMMFRKFVFPFRSRWLRNLHNKIWAAWPIRIRYWSIR